MRITSKGQVTIPQEIREKAGLLPGTAVEFEYRDGQVILRPAPASLEERLAAARRAIESTAGSANNPFFKGWTTDQIMQFLRGDD